MRPIINVILRQNNQYLHNYFSSVRGGLNVFINFDPADLHLIQLVQKLPDIQFPFEIPGKFQGLLV